MKITDIIPEKTVVHCPTKAEAAAVCKIFDGLGMRWFDNAPYVSHGMINTMYERYHDSTVYNPHDGLYSPLFFYRERQEYIVIKAAEFIKLYKERLNTITLPSQKKTQQKQMKPLKYFTTQTLNIAGHQRDVTIAVLWDIGTLHAGYAVRNPIDTVVNRELAKTIAIGRALSERTNLLNGENLGTMSHRYILKAIAESLIRAIEAGHIKIKGVK